MESSEGNGEGVRGTRAEVHTYGQQGALCWEAECNRRGEPTIAVDAALAIGERSYDWKRKVRLQLTVEELCEVAAVLLGMAPRCQALFHGTKKNKQLSLENQGTHFFVRVNEGVRTVSVKLLPREAVRVSLLCLRQVQANWHGVDAMYVLAALRQAGRMLSGEPRNGE